MGSLGLPELIVIFVVLLLLFGANRIPQLARSLGKSVGEFKRGLADQPDADAKKAEEAKKGEEAGEKKS